MTSLSHSLRTKLTVAFVVPVLVVTVFFSAYYTLHERGLLVDEARMSAGSLSEMLAFSVGQGLGQGDYDLVLATFEWAKGHPNVAYVGIVDDTGEALAEHTTAGLSLGTDGKSVAGDGISVDERVDVVEAARYEGADFGKVVVSYSLAPAFESANQTLLTALLISLVVLGLSVLVLSRITGRVAGGVIQLRDAAARVAAGHLDEEVAASQATDEVGDLSRSFADMLAQLRTSQSELVAEKSAVESRVEAAVAEAEAEKAYLSRSVDTLVAEMERFAEGNLDVSVHAERGDDEIGRLYNAFERAAAQLRSILTDVRVSVENTSTVCAQIDQASDGLSRGTQQQSEQAANVAAAVEEMVRTISENAGTTTRTADVARRSGETAREGGQVVSQAVGKMRDIADVVHRSAASMQRLGESSQRIGEVVSIIDDIAGQINLLALNATIEAARAGEHGRGFAVVAEEVRKLAERTTGATQEIGGVIGTIQTEMAGVVNEMGRGTSEVTQGVEMADRAQQSLAEIVTQVEEVQEMVAQIAAASEEQSVTSEEMARNVEMIARLSQDAAGEVEQVAHMSTDLERLADGLRTSVGRFRFRTPDKTSGDGVAAHHLPALSIAR